MASLQRIAHRGNTNGKNPDEENKIEYLMHAYDIVGAVECDIQTYNGKLYFGHDAPQETVDTTLIMQDLWFCHAKDLESLEALLTIQAHAFWHQTDKVTLTSRGYIWCYPGQYPTMARHKTIWLDFDGKFPIDKLLYEPLECWGLCSDDFT
jgi:hypothetical protein